MEKMTIEGKDFIIITRDDGSRQSIEINPENPEYMAMMQEQTADE